MNKGNVVKWKHKKDLYVVVDSSYNHLEKCQESLLVIPFKGSNCTLLVSRKHPFKKHVKTCDCDCYCDCTEFKEVIDEENSIDNIVYVAPDVHTFINNKLLELIYGEGK